MAKYGVETKFSFLFNESLITRARNYLVDEFLRSGFTHLLFIDSDIHYSPQDVLALLALDKDVIGVKKWIIRILLLPLWLPIIFIWGIIAPALIFGFLFAFFKHLFL
jgi:hypothetical protein